MVSITYIVIYLLTFVDNLPVSNGIKNTSETLRTNRNFFLASKKAKLVSILDGSIFIRSSSISAPFDLTLLVAESVVLLSLAVDGFLRYLARISSDDSKKLPTYYFNLLKIILKFNTGKPNSVSKFSNSVSRKSNLLIT